jgi:hypothetical protein
MNKEAKPKTPPLPLIVKIGIALTAMNTWVIFEEVVVDRHGLWHYMPFYRVGLFCSWDASVLAIILMLVLLSIAPLRDLVLRMVHKARKR